MFSKKEMDPGAALETWVRGISFEDEFAELFETSVSRSIQHWGGHEWVKVVRSDLVRRWIRVRWGPPYPSEEITTQDCSWYVSNVGPVTLLACDNRFRIARRKQHRLGQLRGGVPPDLRGTILGWLTFGGNDPWLQIAEAYVQTSLRAFSVAPGLTPDVLQRLRVAHHDFPEVLAGAFERELRMHQLVPTTCRQVWLDRYTGKLTDLDEFREILTALSKMSVMLPAPQAIATALQDSSAPGLSCPTEVSGNSADRFLVSEEVFGESNTWSDLPILDPEALMINWLKDPRREIPNMDMLSVESLMLLAQASRVSKENAEEWEDELTVVRGFPTTIVRRVLQASLEWLSGQPDERLSRSVAFEWGTVMSCWVSFEVVRIRPKHWAVLRYAQDEPSAVLPSLLGVVSSPSHGRKIAECLMNDPGYQYEWEIDREYPPTLWSDLPECATSSIRAWFEI